MPLFRVAALAFFATASSQETLGRHQPSGTPQEDELSLLQSYLAVDGNRGEDTLEAPESASATLRSITRELVFQVPDLFGGQSPISIIRELSTLLRNSAIVGSLTSAAQSAVPDVQDFLSQSRANITTLQGAVAGATPAQAQVALKAFVNDELMAIARMFGNILFAVKPALDAMPSGGIVDRVLPNIRSQLSGTEEEWVNRQSGYVVNATNEALDAPQNEVCGRLHNFNVLTFLRQVQQVASVRIPAILSQVQRVANTVIPLAGFLFSDIVQPLRDLVDRFGTFTHDAVAPLATGLNQIIGTIESVTNVSLGCGAPTAAVPAPVPAPTPASVPAAAPPAPVPVASAPASSSSSTAPTPASVPAAAPPAPAPATTHSAQTAASGSHSGSESHGTSGADTALLRNATEGDNAPDDNVMHAFGGRSNGQRAGFGLVALGVVVCRAAL